MRILLVDDDEQLMEILAHQLIQQHYAVDIASNGEMGWEFILLFNYDLVVLDWMLPDLDGISLCRRIRSENYQMPIMLLTARDRYIDRVIGLDAGADDYLVKPFNFDELTARIRALLRREIQINSPILAWQDLSLDPRNYEVEYQSKPIHLTPKEYGLLELFMRHPQQVFTPTAIIDNLWAGEDTPGAEAVRTHIKGLRQKLKQAGMEKDTIKTVYGIGYRLKNTTRRSQKLESKKIIDKSSQIAPTWLTFKNATWQRLAILENLTTALSENKVSRELYTEAKSSAHKLAGSLGSFGFPKGSKIAKQIENLLEDNSIAFSERQQVIKSIASLNEELQYQSLLEKKQQERGNISLLISDRDTNFGKQLASAAEKNGMKIYTTSNLDRAKTTIADRFLAALLLKGIFPDEKNMSLGESIQERVIQLPLITIAEDPQLLDRLDILRYDRNITLQQPIFPSLIFSSVTELIKEIEATTQVFIVDDGSQVLLYLEVFLQSSSVANLLLKSIA